MSMNIFKLLKTLTETPGPSGFEDEIAAVVEEVWQPYVDSISRDRIGSLIALKEGQGEAPRRRILLAAHMDEIGLMVREIEEHNGYGFLRLTNLGGVDIRQLYGQLVTVHGRKKCHGVIGSLPGHMLPSDRKNKPFGFEEYFVDIGLPIAAVKENISVGDCISFRQPLRKLLTNRAAGKSIDNRASVAAVAVCLEALQKREHAWDVLAVATAQEETRLLGAYTSTHNLQPDLAIAIDVTFGKGPGASDETTTHELGGGPALDLGPNVHTALFNALRETAAHIEMKVNIETHQRGSGTDAIGLQVARAGVPTAVVAIPLRYMHTMVESISIKDIERSGRLLAEFIADLDDAFLDKLAKEMVAEA